jgi:hypothetical protein
MILDHLAPVAALVLYLLAAGFYSSISSKLISIGRWVVLGAIIFHLYSIVLFTGAAASHLLAMIMSLTALALGLYFYAVGGGQFKSLRQLGFSVLIALYLASSVLMHLSNGSSSFVKSVYLLWSHVGLSFIGLLSILVSGILSLLYLSQAKALKQGDQKNSKALASIIGRLPPLRELSRLSKLTTKIGLAFMLIGLYLGFLYTESSGVRIQVLDPKLTLPTLVVIFYSLILLFRTKLSETLFSKLSSSGMILTITSLIVASLK